MTDTKDLLNELEKWASDRSCSCEDKIHDLENLMGELLNWCDKKRKEILEDELGEIKEFRKELKGVKK